MTTETNYPVYPGWETVRLIGRGSFGAVYEIERDLFGKVEKAALKQISIPQDQGDVEELYSTGYDDASITAHYQSYLADIVKEYQMMADMKGHTNVVNCDDIRYVQKDSGIGWDIYMKMELLTPMMKALDQVKEEEQIIKLGKDIASALVLCRNRNIIHRDIKPQNIFLSKDGDFKLGDFGIAKTAEKTSGGTKIGTYNYMAPEVYNNQPYGHEADIYSLGMVMYWLLNERRLPFYPPPPTLPKSSEMDRARQRRFSGEAIPAPMHGSPALQRIVLKACSFDPKDRYHSADEMLRELNKLGSEEALPVVTPPQPEEDAGGASGYHEQDKTVSAATGGVLMGELSANRIGVDTTDNTEQSELLERGFLEAEEDGTISVSFGTLESGETQFAEEGLDYRSDAQELASEEGFDFQSYAVESEQGEATIGGFGAVSVTGKTKQKKEKPAKQKKEKPQKKEKTPKKDKDNGENAAIKQPEKKKSGLLIAAIAAVLAIAALAFYFMLPRYGEWSKWSTVKPTAAAGRKIETGTQYRYRNQELLSTTEKNKVVGEIDHETIEMAAWGRWGAWQETPIEANDNLEVETKVQYRTRSKETTTSSEEELEGWIQDGTTTVEDWGNWTLWKTEQPVVKEGTRKISSKTQYCAYYQIRNKSNKVTNSHKVATNSSDWRDTQDFGSPGSLHHTSGSSKYYTYYDTRTVWSYCDLEEKTVYSFYRWSDWSNWSFISAKESDSKEVETRTVYRCREKVEAPVYYYYDWGEWSEWSLNEVAATATREVETRTVYRYANQK